MKDLDVRFEIEYKKGKEGSNKAKHVKNIVMYAKNGEKLGKATLEDNCLDVMFFNDWDPSIDISETKTVEGLQYQLLDTLATGLYDDLKIKRLECSMWEDPKQFIRYQCNNCFAGFGSDVQYDNHECPYCGEKEDFTDVTNESFYIVPILKLR